MGLLIFMSATAYAQSDEWTVVNYSDSYIESNIHKIGNYFFDFTYSNDEYKLCYSVDGVNYVETDYITETMPIYSAGKYFVIDETNYSVPENKRTYGFNNSPSYILDEHFNLLKKLDHNGFAQYLGFYDGFHYIKINDYNSIIFDGSWKGETEKNIYRTSDGINIEPVPENLNLKFLGAKQLYNGDMYYTTFSQDDVEKSNIITNSITYEILREKMGFISTSYEKNNSSFLIMNYKVGEKTYQGRDGREYSQCIEKRFISIDGVYGIEMPDDIGKYLFEKDGVLFFEKDSVSCYCLDKSKLSDKITLLFTRLRKDADSTPPKPLLVHSNSIWDYHHLNTSKQKPYLKINRKRILLTQYPLSIEKTLFFSTPFLNKKRYFTLRQAYFIEKTTCQNKSFF